MAAWTGENDSGPRDFSTNQVASVVLCLKKHQGERNKTTTEIVAAVTGIEGRTLRSIFSAIDGVELVIGYDGRSGVFACETAEEAEAFSRRLESQAKRMFERVGRRRSMLPPVARQLAFDERKSNE